jgi:hypothetical protein
MLYNNIFIDIVPYNIHPFMQYPSLYGIVQRKQVTVATMLGHTSLNIAFCRNLTGDKWNQ